MDFKSGYKKDIKLRQLTDDSIILFFSVDEKDALDKFFKLLEEFLYQAKIVEDKHNLVEIS